MMHQLYASRAAKLALMALLALLIICPLLFILYTSIETKSGIDITQPFKIISDHALLEVLLNTLLLGAAVVVLSTLIALPLAFLAAKTTIGRYVWLDIVLVIPFMTPPYIDSMGWILFMQKNGFLSQLIPAADKYSGYFFGLPGMVLVMSLHLFPFLYLLLRGTIEKIGSGLEEAGAIFGGGSLYRMKRILLPLVLSAYAMGALLVFIKTISEFGTPATFGRQIGFYVLTSEIHTYVSSWPIDFGKATALASVLLGTCMLFWYVQSTISRRSQYAMIGGKGTKLHLAKLTGWKGFAAWTFIGAVLATAIAVPYSSIIIASCQKLRSKGLAFDNFTLEHYQNFFQPGSQALKALGQSAMLAFLAASFAVLLGLLLVLHIRKSKKASERALDMTALLPDMVPSIIIVIGLILFWNSGWMPAGLYGTTGFVVLTYVVLFIPYAIQYLKSSFVQVDGVLLESGKIFGGRPFYIFRRILLPLLVPGMVYGWIMIFSISTRELVASLLVLPPDMQVSSTYIFSQFEQGSVSEGMAMALIVAAFTTTILLVMQKVSARFR